VASETPDETPDYAVSGVDHVDPFRRVGVPGFAESPDLAHCRLPTDERPRLGPTGRGTPNDIGSEEVFPRIHASGVPGIETGTNELHVLLRHRLLRESGGFEGLLLVVVIPQPHDPAVAELREDGIVPAKLYTAFLPVTIIRKSATTLSSPEGRSSTPSILQLSQLASQRASHS
jgi:hypothetical protein